MSKAIHALSLAGVLGALAVATPSTAHAQVGNTVSPTAKGIVGCALLGAEVVTLIEAGAGARPHWAYAVGAGLGAVAGGVGGYFLEQAAVGDTTLTGVTVGTLVLGLGALIPSFIAYRSATAYQPDEHQTEDNTPSTGPLDESTGTSSAAGGAGTGTAPSTAPSGGSTAPASGTTAPSPSSGGATDGPAPTPSGNTSLHLPAPTRSRMSPTGLTHQTGFVDVASGSFSLAVPSVGVFTNVSREEQRQWGVSVVNELRIPVLSGSF